MRSLYFETPQHEILECETLVKKMHGTNKDGECHLTGNNFRDECMQILKRKRKAEVF